VYHRDRERERDRDYDRERERDYDRDRDRDRDRNDGYHPARRSPPRDNYPRGGAAPPSNSDSYIPGPRPPRRRSRSPAPYRRRSRSPVARENNWRDRERQVSPRRGYSPRRIDDRRVFREDERRDNRYHRSEPVRDTRYVRSPRRERSPSPVHQKRGREYSPERNRSPPSKRDRINSPPRHHYQA
jgi:hypothetical protein